LEEEIYNKLINVIDSSIYEIKRDVEIGSFVINLAIYDKVTNNYLLGIECFERKDYTNESETSDDVYRQYYLKIRGWNIHKLWISDWLNDEDEEISKIFVKLNALKEDKKY